LTVEQHVYLHFRGRGEEGEVAGVFRYACLISYRHGHQPGTQRFYEAFRRELAIQVDFYLPGMDVYLDTNRVRGGDFFNRELASVLCSSVCMVMLFNPLYFDASNSYAAREYRAMVALEQQRLIDDQAGIAASLALQRQLLAGERPER
jgi:hypothetical protein